MEQRSLGLLALLSLMATLITTVIFALGDVIFGLPLLPFNFFDWIARTLPGDLITQGIDLMVDVLILFGMDVSQTAKPAEQIMAFVMVGALLVALGTVLLTALDQLDLAAPSPLVGAGVGLVIGLSFAVVLGQVGGYGPIDVIWLAAVMADWGAMLGFGYDRTTLDDSLPDVEQLDRRAFLVRAGGATAAFTVVGAGLSVALNSSRTESTELLAEDQPEPTPNEAGFVAATISGQPVTLPNTEADVQPVDGTRPEYTPLDSHYQIDINTRPPTLEEEEWRLNITGMVDTELNLTLRDIVENYQAREEFVTLSCISNRIAGSLISTTLWTGVPVRDVLADAGLQDGAEWLFIESADGFFESVNLEMVMNDPRIMFAYAWDRQPLKIKHGFPLRIWIPDRYGMKQPKWIESVTVQSNYEEGYWVVRNWDEDAIVQPTSVIDTVDMHMGTDGQTAVPIGGIAYSGAKGISRVEVQVDEGEWEMADIRRPLSDYTWVLWRYEWPFEEGRHTIRVRCYTADGNLQPTENSDVRPDGATGIHSVTETF